MLSSTESRTLIRRWGMVLIMLMLLALLLFSCLLSYRWIFASSAPEAIPVSIRSGLAANYGAEVFLLPIPALQLEIIQDVIHDQQTGSEGGPIPAAALLVELLTPVPSVTPIPTSTVEEGSGQLTPTLDGLALLSPTPTNTISASATTSLNASPTATPQPTSTSVSNNTSTPTSLFESTPTSTALFAPTQTGTALFIPTNTPTLAQTQLVCQPPDEDWGFVSSIEPEDETRNVPVNTVIIIVFNQPMNEASLLTAEVELRGERVEYTKEYDARTNTLRIIPSEPLEFDQEYEVKIKRNVLNDCGNRQGIEVKTKFETVESPPPTSTPQSCKPPDRDWGYVASISPANGAENVPVSTIIVIVFDQPMDLASLMSTEVQLKGDVDGYSKDYDPDTYTLTIIPRRGLESAERYEVRIKRNVKNSCGVPQGFEVRIRFETEDN
ncbi:MAG: hypothetical protein FVQ83_05970 [Chloroflexi bacterium]|nr:hypothetical protein [Chloroflexota bacterium]